MKTAVGVCAYRVYIHGIGVPFSFEDRVHPMLSYMLIWRRHLLLLSLSVMVILGPTYAREVRVIDSLRHFYYIAIQPLIYN